MPRGGRKVTALLEYTAVCSAKKKQGCVQSVLERAVTLSQAGEILPGDLPAALQQIGSSTQTRSNRVERAKTLKQVEEEYIRVILDETGCNYSQAARMLGIDRRTLYRRLAEMENEEVSE